jgi:hypothetical protein
MIAYVFWHWPSPAVAGAAYEQALLAFHGALANARLPGFQESVVCRVEGAGWLPRQPTAYEDWYLVHDFTALGLVNEGAVAGACRAPHEAVARHAAGGTAGLYGLARGAEDPPTQPCATWLAKPAGMSYERFFAALAAWSDRAGTSLWQRQLVLGPTPEFCLLSPAPADLDLPGLAPPLRVTRRLVWPPARL